MLELGFDGIKLFDMNPRLRRLNGRGVDNVVYDEMFNLLEEYGTPVLMHANDPMTFWVSPDNHTGLGKYTVPEYESYETIFQETLAMLRKHPKLNIVLAHFFFLAHNPEQAAWFLDTFPNVKLDLTPGTEMYSQFAECIDEWHDFFCKYQDRILFGTDTNTYKDFNKEINQLVYTTLTHDKTEFVMPCYGRYIIRGLGLDEAVVDHICYQNYVDFVGEEPKKADVNRFQEVVEYILKDMKANPRDPYYDAAGDIFPYLKEDPKQEIAIRFFERVLENI